MMFENLSDLSKSLLLKIILVTVIGLFGLSLLFNLISGGGNMMDSNAMSGGNMMGGYNNSFGGLLSSVLMLLVTLFMVLLVVVVILGIVAWVRETFFKGGNIQLSKTVGNDPVIKSVTVVTLVILGLVLVAAFFNSFMSGSGFNMGYNMGGYRGTFYYGYNPGFSIVGILALLIRLLTFVFIISLILAVVVYLKNQYESGKLNFFTENKDRNTAATVNEPTAATTGSVATFNGPTGKPGNIK